MFGRFWTHLRSSRLAQAGAVLVILGGTSEALDQLGTVDLSAVPYVGHYAPAIIATAGVLKIILRMAMFLITGLGTADKDAK